jgi:hypothetical protein
MWGGHSCPPPLTLIFLTLILMIRLNQSLWRKPSHPSRVPGPGFFYGDLPKPVIPSKVEGPSVSDARSRQPEVYVPVPMALATQSPPPAKINLS